MKLLAQFELDILMPLAATKLQSEIDLLDAQKLKVDKEVEFLIQKIVTELANVDGTVFDAESVVGRQTSLLLAQKFGFAGDIQTKTAKLHADYDAIYQSVQESTAPGSEELSDNAQTAIITALDTASQISSA